MRILLLASVFLVAPAIVPAWAEDFTGFYAGVNAGYGFEKSNSDARGPGTIGLGSPGASESGLTALPPSAQDASRALQSRNRSSGGGTAFPR